jgi:hypothetical protein
VLTQYAERECEQADAKASCGTQQHGEGDRDDQPNTDLLCAWL